MHGKKFQHAEAKDEKPTGNNREGSVLAGKGEGDAVEKNMAVRRMRIYIWALIIAAALAAVQIAGTFLPENGKLIGILVILFLYIVIVIVFILKFFMNKKFNNHGDWDVLPVNDFQKLKDHFMKNMLDLKSIPLEEGENIIANIDFEFFPLSSSNILTENAFDKIIYLTNKRLILARYSLSLKHVKVKSIPFSQIAQAKVMKRLFGIPTTSYAQLTLKSGQIYQLGLNMRLLSDKRMADYQKIMDFFKELAQHTANSIPNSL